MKSFWRQTLFIDMFFVIDISQIFDNEIRNEINTSFIYVIFVNESDIQYKCFDSLEMNCIGVADLQYSYITRIIIKIINISILSYQYYISGLDPCSCTISHNMYLIAQINVIYCYARDRISL